MNLSSSDQIILDSAKRNFHDYVCLMNHGYKASKFSKALCWIIQEAMMGRYKNKIVVVHGPPRSGKSVIISESAGPWFSGHYPNKSAIMGSANEDLASRFSAKMREKVSDPRHEAIFGEDACLGSRARANDYNLKAGGEVKAIGMNSDVIGRGASLIIIDDPFGKLSEARDPSYREQVWTKFIELLTRLNSGDSTVIIVAQRLHKDDLSGRLMRERKDQCVYFAFPAVIEDEGDMQRDVLRRGLGESVVPELFSAEDYFKIKAMTEPDVWLAAYKGVPPGEDGARFKDKWLKSVDIDPSWAQSTMSLYLLGDPAGSTKVGSDYSAFFIVGCDENKNFFILDAIRERLELKDRWKKYRDLWKKWRPMESWYEAYGASADLDYFKEKQEDEKVFFEIQNSAYLNHTGVKRKEGEKGEKDVRIERLIPQMSDGRWFYREGISHVRNDGGSVDKYDPIAEMITDEMSDWPMAKNDDCLDAISRINDVNVVWPIGTTHKVPKTIKAFASPW